MKTLGNLEIKNIFVLITLGVVAYLTILIFSPYINIIIISLVLVQIFHPIYKLIYKHTNSKALGTIVSIFTAILFMIIPITILVLLTLSEVTQLTKAADILGNLGTIQSSVNDAIGNVNNFFANLNLKYSLSSLDIQEIAVGLADTARAELFPFVQQILTLSGGILFSLFLLIICMIYLFPLYEKLPEIFGRISPLDKELDQILFDRFRSTTKGVIKGSFFVAILQATAVMIPLVILNVGAPVLLWIIMILLSILPIGSGLVWGPIGLFMLVQGIQTGNTGLIVLAISLLIYSAVIINVIDTLIRPRVMKNSINIHPLVTIFSVFGGLYYFGPLGILYGPLIVVFFISIIDIYHKKFLTSEEKLITKLTTDEKDN